MKIVAVNKTTIITSTCSNKGCYHCSTSANHLHSLNKLWNFLKTESGTIWTPPSSSILADPTPPPPASITSTTTRISPTIHSVTTQEEASPELQQKVATSTTPIFLTMAMSGTLTHLWNMTMTSTPKISKTNHDFKNMIFTQIFETIIFLTEQLNYYFLIINKKLYKIYILKTYKKPNSQINIKMINQSRRIINSLLIRSMMPFSRSDLINVPPPKYADHRQQLLNNGWRDTDPTHTKSQQTHLSNGEYLIHKVPVIYSHESVVRCIGGTELNTGHPQVYIQLNTKTPGEPVPCKWCGLRYALDTHHH